MKLENVAYCYRRNLDRWLIIFPTHAEAKAFETLYSDGKYKPTLSTYSKTITETETTRYRAIYAKLTGRFEQLRQLYKAKHKHDTIVDDLESDGTFDKIELIFDTESGIASFRIEKFETWTDWACKSILNSQFGTVAQANGYYDTDTVGQGGLCTRRSCCGIGIGEDPNTQRTDKERIIFTVKNFCRGEADIIKVSAWTNTFIGTNKENEKEYSWNDFKHYMGLLRSDGSDIWDTEWEYDAACPMTGTEVADKLHLYLKPEAYKRLFEKEKKVWISTGTLWSNGDYLARVQALTSPPVPKWVKLDEDCKKRTLDGASGDYWHVDENVCEYYKRDADICKEFTTATPPTQACLVEPIIFINHKACTFTEFIKDSKETQEKETKNKEENNMKIYWDESQPRIENVRDIVLCSYRYDRSVYYYRVYFESIIDAKNVMECTYNQDRSKHCWYYMTIASTAELSEEMMGTIKTLYLTYNKNETRYYINWKAMGSMSLKAAANFEMKMTAQLNDEQLKVWEAALGIGNQPKHKKEKTVGDVVNELTEEQKKVLYYLIAEAQKSGKAETPEPTKILIQGTATIIWWSDGTKTIVKCQKGDKMDPEKGIAMCVMKKFMGTNETHSNYLDFAKDAIEKAKKKAEADKRRRAAAKKKGADGNANYKRTTKKHPIETLSDAITALARETNADKEES